MKPERYNSDRAAHFAHLNYLIRITKDELPEDSDRWIAARSEYLRLVPEEGGGTDPRSAFATAVAFFHQGKDPHDTTSYVDSMASNQESRSHSATTKRHLRRELAE